MLEKSQNARSAIMGTLRSFLDCIKRYPYVFIVIIAAFWLYMLVIVPSGSEYCTVNQECGIFFWGAHEHDGIWHIALIETAFKSYPFNFPTFAGAHLSGYNFLLDIALWLGTRVGLSSWDLYFRIQPIVWFLFFCSVLYSYTQIIRKSRAYTTLVFFTTFFASSLGFVIQYVRHGSIAGASGIPTMQGALSMTNPQFLWSATFLLLLSILFHKKASSFWIGICVFVISGLKAYALIPLGILIAHQILVYAKARAWRRMVRVVFATLIALGSAYYLFYASNTSSGIKFDFMALPRQIVEDPQMWHQPALISQWYALKDSLGPRFIFVIAQIIFYFVVFNYGIRLLGLFSVIYYLKARREAVGDKITLWFSLVLISTLMPILFVQSGDWWNTIQFMYFGLFYANFLLAETLYLLWKRHKILSVMLCIVCGLLFVPATADVVMQFGMGTPSHVSRAEIDVLRELRKLPDGIVWTQAFEKRDGRGLSHLFDTAYVTALSGKVSYFADKKQLELLNVYYLDREKMMSDQETCYFETNVMYIYLLKSHSAFAYQNACLQSDKNFKVVRENAQVKLWMKR